MLGRITTYNSLNHIGSTLSHAAGECVHIDLALGVSLIQQRVQRNVCTRATYPGTDTAT